MADEIVNQDLTRDLLKKQPLFSKLNEEELDILAGLMVEQTYAPGGMIVQQGKPVDSVFIIADGTADVLVSYLEENQLKRRSVAKLTAPQAIGLNERGLYSLSGKRTATVIAETEMSVLRLSTAALNGFALAYPRVGEIMHRGIHSGPIEDNS